ncbi:IS21 family transposase [Sporosarcina trichiuri]|uniref:IS21 family transposase n=1 Tax=Sporosarcina trichiuri TaxID=3056445 RepID=UPI0025B2BD96|nr:IS21 family transposase [Sporosarcina sp. 0.2-SM1T-5]WJY26407.1 IS21 family transposase [Sporosarcina sp. 0.2-SM1T-5]
MLAMSEVHCIKTLRNNKGLTISEIARTMSINWRTAKKYADDNQLPEVKIKKRRGMMYESKWGEIVGDWLEEDAREKRKSRRTNKQMHQELVELGFTGSYRTLCDFIKIWRASNDQKSSPDTEAERLEHPPGQAQVDFGVMEAVQGGVYKDVRALVMSFPASNAAFCVPMPSENQECFLSGLKMLFAQAGGVPLSIRIDNLSPAVKKVRGSHGEAELTDGFAAFQAYYGFDVQVCNPNKGNEKGHVERKVGYVRYNFFSVPPVMIDWDDLRSQLLKVLTEDRQRLHYTKRKLIEELWQEERQVLLKLPDEAYPVFKQTDVSFNKYSEFKLDNRLIHVPGARKHANLTCVAYWDTFKVITEDGEVLLSDHRPYLEKRRLIPWYEIMKIWRTKRGRSNIPGIVGICRLAYWTTYPSRVEGNARNELNRWFLF